MSTTTSIFPAGGSAAPTSPWSRNGVPIITAGSVHQLQESLGWWRVNQGGITTAGSVLEGINVGSYSCRAEHLDDYNIMTRLSWRTGTTGGHFATRLNMAQKAKDGRYQIGTIIHQNHPTLKNMGITFPEGEQYALAGYWILTDFWVDWEVDKQVLVIRLEKVTRNSVWWRSVSTGNEMEIDQAPLGPAHMACQTCGLDGRVRYVEGFLCGRPECVSIQTPDSSAVIGLTRTYRKDYLSQRASMNNLPLPPYRYLPDVPSQPTLAELRAIYAAGNNTKPLWKGYLCANCRVFNQRIFWNRLECRKCHNVLNVRLPDLTFEDLQEEHWNDLQDDSDIPGIKIVADANIVEDSRTTERFIVRRWTLYDNNYVWLILPRRKAIYEPGGFKELFDRLWKASLNGEVELSRRPMNNNRNQLTAWFCWNFGVNYVTHPILTPSTPFSQEPQVITDVRAKLTSIVQELVGEDPAFNELLAIGMYPNMHMGWHNDGEKTVLGNIVASVSLGDRAEMSFGVNHRYRMNRTSNIDDPVIPGCSLFAERQALKTAADAGQISREQHKTQLQALVSQLPVQRDPKPLLTYPLPGTGAIMVQQGPTLNRIYQHKVDGKGICRFVTTGRLLKEPLVTTENYDDGNDTVEVETKPGRGSKRTKTTDAKAEGPAKKKPRTQK